MARAGHSDRRLQILWGLLLLVVLLGTGFLLGQRRPSADSLPSASSTVSLATDRTTYAPGQPVTLTLQNRGTAPVTIALDPPYVIRKGMTMLYRPVVALPRSGETAVLTLQPGEQHSWVWDQTTLAGLVDPGTYQFVITYWLSRSPHTITAQVSIKR